MQPLLGWTGKQVWGIGFLGQGLSGPKTKCEISVFHQHQVGYDHHENPEKEVQAIRCSPFLAGRATMLWEWASQAKASVAQKQSAKVPRPTNIKWSMNIV